MSDLLSGKKGLGFNAIFQNTMCFSIILYSNKYNLKTLLYKWILLNLFKYERVSKKIENTNNFSKTNTFQIIETP